MTDPKIVQGGMCHELRWMLVIAAVAVGLVWGIVGIVQMFLVPWPRAR